MRSNHILKYCLLISLFFIITVSNAIAGIPGAKDSLRNFEVKVPMQDGTLLSTDIFLPKKHKRVPAVLVRTPYNKYAEQWMGKAFNMFGIAVVIQDVRGKFKSEGEFYPFINERADGLQTLRWIRNQKWSDGVVAGWGGSYVGYTQWAISDSLDYLTLLLTGSNLYDFTYPEGLFSLQSAFVWGFQNAGLQPNTLTPEKLRASTLLLPLNVADDSTIQDIPFINDWLAHEKYDSYWKQMDFRGKTNAQIISFAGWYDIFLKAQLADFQALEKNGPNSNRLVIGPWCHGSQAEPNEYGGLKKTGNPRKIFMYVKNELKHKKNKLTSPLKNNKYNLFIMERNEYVGSDVWPPEETTMTPYYIGENRYLSSKIPEKEGSLEYEYKPGDPYPGHGGTALGDGVGPARQNENTDRKDQLVFEMNIDKNPLILLGNISATLWLSSNAACTDFFVELQDVFPDGKIINIQEGGAKVNLNNINPEKTEISVWATGYQLNPNHTLRIVITSSWFPRFNRNLNTCGPISTSTEIVNATQKVYFGGNTPSSINLPVYQLRTK